MSGNLATKPRKKERKMDAYEATKVVFQRIQSLEPEHASKIMGLLLIHDHGEKEMIRLAFGTDSLLQSVIVKTKMELGLSPPINSPSTPSSPSPFRTSISVPFSRQSSSSSVCSGRIPSPLSVNTQSSNTSSWATLSPSTANGAHSFSPASSMNSAAPPFYGGGGEVDLIDEFQLQDQLSFLNDGSPRLGRTKSSDIFYPQQDLGMNGGGDSPHFYSGWGPHRRSCSVSDVCLGSDDPNCGFGWKPCLYYARGFCKNGTSCRFLHSEGTPDGGMVESPSKLEMMEQCHELLRSKSASHHHHHHRLAAASQLMSSPTFPYSPVSPNKCMDFLLQQQVDSPRGAGSLMMGDDLHKFSRGRFERGDLGMNFGANSSSRQIYLTFPADSTFKEEDVSNYFSNYGPVQDVRIPYQQKRMFGFVTFIYAETVKIILAKGNPHFVCDARVLVKPYKEKGKVPEKFRKQEQMEALFTSSQDALWRRKLEEQADLQQAIELHSRRLMNLQLLDIKRNSHQSPFSPLHSPAFSPAHENGYASKMVNQVAVGAEKEVEPSENGQESKKESPKGENDTPESVEDSLPDNPFSSPKASVNSSASGFLSSDFGEGEKLPLSGNNIINNSLMSSSSPLFPASAASLDMTPLKACYLEVARFSSGAIGM